MGSMAPRMSITASVLVVAGLCWTGCAEGVSPGRNSGGSWGNASVGGSWGGSGGPEDTDGAAAQAIHEDLSATWSVELDAATRPRMDATAGGVVLLAPDTGVVTAYGERGPFFGLRSSPPRPVRSRSRVTRWEERPS